MIYKERKNKSDTNLQIQIGYVDTTWIQCHIAEQGLNFKKGSCNHLSNQSEPRMLQKKFRKQRYK